MASEMPMAATGTTGPNGTTKTAGLTTALKREPRRRSADAHVATYTRRRLIALAAAIVWNVPDTASASATEALTRIAFDGVLNVGCTRPKKRGRSPCSASANRFRDPDSA